MIAGIPEPQLAALSVLVAEQLGLHFPQPAWPDLARGVAAVVEALAFPDAATCADWLLAAPGDPARREVLARHLTIGETYFFREQPALDILRTEILPALIRARSTTTRHLRLWSAACCTGEEAYTLAIIVSQLLPDPASWDVTLLGTDLNPAFLERARAGVYRDWSFRGTPASLRTRYFVPAGEQHAIREEIRRMVQFAPLNLVGDSYPSLAGNTTEMDVICCRNVLMYFAPDRAAQVAGNLHRALGDGGWLIVGATEVSPAVFPQYERVLFPDAILYRKSRAQAGQALTTAAPGRSPRHAGAAAEEAVAPRRPVRDTARPRHDARAVRGAPPVSAPLDAWASAQACYARGDYDAARTRALVLVHGPEAPAPICALLARIAANQGDLATAGIWCERAAAGDPLNAAYHYLRATILQEQGAIAAATAVLRRVLYLDPGFVPAHFALGNYALQQGNIAEARRRYLAARALLRTYAPDALVPETADLTAGRLDAMIAALLAGQEAETRR